MTNATPTSVYLYYDPSDILIYVGITSRGAKRQSEHNAGKEWWRYVARQAVEHYPSRAEASDRERDLIQRHMPPFNRQHNPAHEVVRTAYLAFRDKVENDPVGWRDAIRAMQQRIELDFHGRDPRTNQVILRTRLQDVGLAPLVRLPEKPARVFGIGKNGHHSILRLTQHGPVALVHLSSTTTHPFKDVYGCVKFAPKQDGLVLQNVHITLDHSDPTLCTKRCRSRGHAPREVRWVRPDSEGRQRI